MPLIVYKKYVPGRMQRDIIDCAGAILEDYREMGYGLTLRQLYYQFVAKDILPDEWRDKATGSKNNERAYKNLGTLMTKARMGGMIDWDLLEDRTRFLRGFTTYDSPQSALDECAINYKIDVWWNQDYAVEVWVEKDALIDVVGQVASSYRVNYFSCRGYTSVSEIWKAGRRMMWLATRGQVPVVLHLGDHDPSGCDMSRDIEARLREFMCDEEEDIDGSSLIFDRIALNMNQIMTMGTPASPAKITDSRAKGYIAEHGLDSWELDAMPPDTMSSLIEKSILNFIDREKFNEKVAEEAYGRDKIRGVIEGQ